METCDNGKDWHYQFDKNDEEMFYKIFFLIT